MADHDHIRQFQARLSVLQNQFRRGEGLAFDLEQERVHHIRHLRYTLMRQEWQEDDEKRRAKKEEAEALWIGRKMLAMRKELEDLGLGGQGGYDKDITDNADLDKYWEMGPHKSEYQERGESASFKCYHRSRQDPRDNEWSMLGSPEDGNGMSTRGRSRTSSRHSNATWEEKGREPQQAVVTEANVQLQASDFDFEITPLTPGDGQRLTSVRGGLDRRSQSILSDGGIVRSPQSKFPPSIFSPLQKDNSGHEERVEGHELEDDRADQYNMVRPSQTAKLKSPDSESSRQKRPSRRSPRKSPPKRIKNDG